MHGKMHPFPKWNTKLSSDSHPLFPLVNMNRLICIYFSYVTIQFEPADFITGDPVINIFNNHTKMEIFECVTIRSSKRGKIRIIHTLFEHKDLIVLNNLYLQKYHPTFAAMTLSPMTLCATTLASPKLPSHERGPSWNTVQSGRRCMTSF